MAHQVPFRQAKANTPTAARRRRVGQVTAKCAFLTGTLLIIAAACGNEAEPPGNANTTGPTGCATGLQDCGTGQCVSTLADANHCGGCNMLCAAGQVCTNGMCSTSCAPGQTLCGASCADIATNAQHCGMCNNTCSSGTCNAGVCSTPTASVTNAGVTNATATTRAMTTGATTTGSATVAGTDATATTTGAGGATSGTTSTTMSGVTTGSGTTGTVAVACSTPLADRVSVTDIAVSPSVDMGSGQLWGATGLPVMLATTPSGEAKAAWSDGSNVHITPLNASDERAGDDISVPGSEVRGLVAHDDGTALLVVDGDQMLFLRLDASGNTAASLTIVGDNSHSNDGDRWIDDWPHNGRLAWSGTEYAAYFGQTGNHGSAGDHQGDHYEIISASGESQSGGWDWGCSHSLDERLAHNGTTFAPICTSDTYPGAGIWFENDVEVSSEPTITNVGGGTKLGGLVPAPDGFWLNFASPEGRSSYDVAFVHIDNSGNASGKTYLTDTASVDERFAHLAAYGNNQLLAGWGEDTDLTLAVIDTSGNIVEGPSQISAEAGGLDDFASYANGDVGWAFAADGASSLQVVRVTRCE